MQAYEEARGLHWNVSLIASPYLFICLFLFENLSLNRKLTMLASLAGHQVFPMLAPSFYVDLEGKKRTHWVTSAAWCSVFATGSYYVVLTGLELMVSLLSLSPQC